MPLRNRRAHPRLTSGRVAQLMARLAAALDLPEEAISVWMAADADLLALNRAWRGRDRPTDVLSFPQGADGLPAALAARAPLGDVVVSYDTAARQAVDAGCSLEVEVCRLLVHGVLHCLGHDHVHGGRQAARMRREERRLLAVLAGGPRRRRRA